MNKDNKDQKDNKYYKDKKDYKDNKTAQARGGIAQAWSIDRRREKNGKWKIFRHGDMTT